MDEQSVLTAFSEDQVERLTGLSKYQLRYWDRTDFFKPSLAYENRRVAYSRIYTFKDIVALRTISVLRNQYSVPLQHLRKVANKLKRLEDRLWTNTVLYVLNRRVHFYNEETDKIEDAIGGQYVLGMRLDRIQSDTQKAVQQLHRRDEGAIGKVVRRRGHSHNAWVVAETRIPIKTIQHFYEDGYSIAQILAEYPSLTRADIQAAVEHKGNGEAA